MSSKRPARAASPGSAQSSRASSPVARKPTARKRRRSPSRSRSRSRSRSPASEPSSSSSSSDESDGSDEGFEGEEPAAPRPRRSEPEAAAAATSPATANGKSRLRAFEDLMDTPSSSGSAKKKKSSGAKASRAAHSKTVGTVVGLNAQEPINSKTIRLGREVEIDGKRYVIIELPRAGFTACPLKEEGENADKGSSRFPSSTRIHMFNHHVTIAPYISGTKKPDKSLRESVVICPDGGVHIVSASLGRQMVNKAVQPKFKGWKTYATSMHFLDKRNLGGGVGEMPEHTIVPWSLYQAELEALKKSGKSSEGADDSTDTAAAAPSAAANPGGAKGRRRPTAAGSAAAANQAASHVELTGQMKMAENYLRRPILQYVTEMATENRQSKSVMARTWKKTCINNLSTLDGVTAATYWHKLTSAECACQFVLFFTPEGGRALDKWIADLSEEETQSYTMQSAIMGSSSSAAAAVTDGGDEDNDIQTSDRSDSEDAAEPASTRVISKIAASSDDETSEFVWSTKKERKEAKRKLKKAKKAEKKEQRRRRKKKAKREEESGSDADEEAKSASEASDAEEKAAGSDAEDPKNDDSDSQ